MKNYIRENSSIIKSKITSERGEMGDSLIIIIAIVLGAIIMYKFNRIYIWYSNNNSGYRWKYWR